PHLNEAVLAKRIQSEKGSKRGRKGVGKGVGKGVEKGSVNGIVLIRPAHLAINYYMSTPTRPLSPKNLVNASRKSVHSYLFANWSSNLNVCDLIPNRRRYPPQGPPPGLFKVSGTPVLHVGTG